MKTASIVFTDEHDGNVNININFGDSGIDENSDAHRMAIDALTLLMKTNEQMSDLEVNGGEE
jgi:hypothetical protein